MKRKFQASFNGFHIDSSSGVSHNLCGEIRLSEKELAVLVELVINAGKLVTKEDLVKAVWGEYSASDSSIARCISAIKSQLKKAAPDSGFSIKMIYGKGYKFVGEVTSSESFLCEESFITLINASPDFILFKDGGGRWLSANQAALQTFALSDLAWQGKTDLELADLLPLSYRPALEACVTSDTSAWQCKISSRHFETVDLSDGSKRIFDVVKSPLFNKDGSRNLLLIFGRDVTDLLQAMERQKLSERVLDNSHEAVLITDENNRIVSVNRAFTTVTGYTEADVVGKNPRLLASARHDQNFYRAMWHQLSVTGEWRGEIWNKKKNGDIYLEWINISAVRNREGMLVNYIANFSDLKKHNKIDENIEFLAYHDPLTRLPNRLLLHDRFQQALAVAKRENTMLAVFFIDLDKFKQINDTLGHEAGDQLLKIVGQRLGRCVREVDTVSRIGGDEFVVLLTDVQTENILSYIAEKILEEMSAPIDVGKMSVASSLSIGISVYPHDGQDLDTLLNMADVSMYRAKNCGRNAYRFFSNKTASEISQPTPASANNASTFSV
jgi:diguanylate cyclase (GGDEF)-like protein/PAS domain S-box-containing protein